MEWLEKRVALDASSFAKKESKTSQCLSEDVLGHL